MSIAKTSMKITPITTRVIVMVTLGGFPHVLMDGLVTRQELGPRNEPGQSILTITGDDLSAAMDLVEYHMPYPNMSSTVQGYVVLSKYMALGVVLANTWRTIFAVWT